MKHSHIKISKKIILKSIVLFLLIALDILLGSYIILGDRIFNMDNKEKNNHSNTYARIPTIEPQLTESKIIDEINSLRKRNGLDELLVNNSLKKAADEKSKDLIENNYLDYNSPDGTTPWRLITNTGYDYNYAGVILGRGYNNPASLVAAWLKENSTSESILSRNYREIGVSVGKDKNTVVVMFGVQRIYRPNNNVAIPIPSINTNKAAKNIATNEQKITCVLKTGTYQLTQADCSWLHSFEAGLQSDIDLQRSRNQQVIQTFDDNINSYPTYQPGEIDTSAPEPTSSTIEPVPSPKDCYQIGDSDKTICK